MFDSHTTFIVATVERYLESIGFNTQIIGYGNIKKYPAKKASGVSFALAAKGNSAGIQYAILFYPTFAKTISAIHNTFETLLNQNSPRATTLKSVLKQDDEYLFVFAFGGGARAEKKQLVIDKLKVFFEKYYGLVMEFN